MSPVTGVRGHGLIPKLRADLKGGGRTSNNRKKEMGEGQFRSARSIKGKETYGNRDCKSRKDWNTQPRPHTIRQDRNSNIHEKKETYIRNNKKI